jgi:hypothetical protein
MGGFFYAKNQAGWDGEEVERKWVRGVESGEKGSKVVT